MLRPIVQLRRARRCRRPAAPVDDVRRRRCDRLIDDMIETMYAAPGIGLAAPQIGVPLRVCVIDLSVGKRGGELLTLVNPEFVERDGMQLEEEGCLSVPGLQRHRRAAGARGRARPRPRRAPRDRSRARACWPARCSTRSITSTACCSSIGCAGIKRDLIVRKIRKLQRAGKW